MLAYQARQSISCGERAVALAREAGDPAIISHALTNIGVSRWELMGDPAGQRTLEEALRIALDAGDVEDACRAYVNIVWPLLDTLRLSEAERVLTASIHLAEETEFLAFLSYMHMEQARLEFCRGSWDAAVRLAGLCLDADLPVRCPAVTVLGRVRVRRGQPEAARLLELAWDLAAKTGEFQRTGPVAAARAEAAWLQGDRAGVRAVAAPAYQEAGRLGDQLHRAELGYWLVKAGQRVQRAGDHPYAVQAAGRWREAAAAWKTADAHTSTRPRWRTVRTRSTS